MEEFEKIIGYTFKNKEYLEVALTHSSYANEHHVRCNERLEFLGDSVLSLVVSENIFKALRKDEGDLSKTRASLVCESALFELSKKIDLSKYLRLGKGEELGGGRTRPALVSDAFEALIAAIFLDSDFETAKEWLLRVMKEELETAGDSMDFGDYKTMLQEFTQKGNHGRVSYRIVAESGPDHDKSFVCAVAVDGKTIAEGSGKTKKEAEQQAAKSALEIL